MAHYCLKCRYPLDHLRQSVCPECGQTFDPTDVETYSTSRRREWRVDFPYRAIWFVSFSVVAFYLFTLQWEFISWWHGTRDWWWIGVRRSHYPSWWELVGPGHWLFLLQMAVIFLLSAVLAVLIARRLRPIEIGAVIVLALVAGIPLMLSSATSMWVRMGAAVVVMNVVTSLVSSWRRR